MHSAAQPLITFLHYQSNINKLTIDFLAYDDMNDYIRHQYSSTVMQFVLQTFDDHALEYRSKRLLDVAGAILGLFLYAIPMVLIILLIGLTSRGPIFFYQKRVGKDGKIFTMVKFRTMYVRDCDATGGRQAERDDARVTWIGKRLRRYSADELPQFFNVLKGDMSLVGPRPHAVTHDREYGAQIPSYTLRHTVNPGMTGWAQINGLRGKAETLHQMQARVHYDLAYIYNESLLLDLFILAKTLKIMFSGKNAY